MMHLPDEMSEDAHMQRALYNVSKHDHPIAWTTVSVFLDPRILV